MSTQQTTEQRKIHRHLTIEQILSMFPHKAQKLSQEISGAGLHCIGCQAATWETLEAGMLGHGMTEEAVERLVGRLNDLLEEKSDPTTITITKRAAEKYLSILADENKQGWGIRLTERMAGCSGFESVLEFSEKAAADDQIFESCGIQIHVKNSIVKHMLGAEIDYIDALQGSGFKISNPNVRSSCGCGSSYNY